MNKITLPTLLFFVLSFFSGITNAQDGYTYTLVHHGGYDFTVQAVPNASANNFATSVQSYGFTIILPDGATVTVTSSLGNAASATFFDGNNVGQPTLDGYLITETLGSPASLAAPSAATNSNIISFTVNGSLTSGTLEILANNSPLASAVAPLKSFMQADMVDNGMAEFVNVVDPNATALSGMSSFSFATLSTPSQELVGVEVYPNPVHDIVNITSANTPLVKTEIFTMNGQLILSKNNNLETMNISQLQSGIYLMKIYAENASKTVKFIKK